MENRILQKEFKELFGSLIFVSANPPPLRPWRTLRETSHPQLYRSVWSPAIRPVVFYSSTRLTISPACNRVFSIRPTVTSAARRISFPVAASVVIE